MSFETLPTSAHVRVELAELYRYHARRCFADGLTTVQRQFHLRQARIIGLKIIRIRERPWTWEEFLRDHQTKP